MENGRAAIDELRKMNIQAKMEVIHLDVDGDSSIIAAEEQIRTNHGRLDCLINNAGIAFLPGDSLSSIRASYASTFNTNITSVACLTNVFLPLLKSSSPSPRIINVSSARASLALSTTGQLPPSRVISYSVSKTALNALTIEFAKAEQEVRFYAASPGHIRTAFNGYQGTKKPLDGAKVVVELASAEIGKYENGFWQTEGGSQEATKVPW